MAIITRFEPTRSDTLVELLGPRTGHRAARACCGRYRVRARLKAGT
ncbi:MAG TPA: hypothetical protein VJ045_12090 [Hyphomicrobiaceae bacterium]|nr:hypothetical protein [Hyphomicrobiaceae bacterium]